MCEAPGDSSVWKEVRVCAPDMEPDGTINTKKIDQST